ncbi:MAG: hypothetical protein RMY36_011090 [Nostoc sp. SerVER01]|nr:hypothetical protein [Nostoc sp. SerVER01]MDZ8025260.1 hypothetical protein [Nostoc sp. DedQUE11]MDZ8077194.1 hypothetical protein [Nostoc sp. DedQUE01]
MPSRKSAEEVVQQERDRQKQQLKGLAIFLVCGLPALANALKSKMVSSGIF